MEGEKRCACPRVLLPQVKDQIIADLYRALHSIVPLDPPVGPPLAYIKKRIDPGDSVNKNMHG